MVSGAKGAFCAILELLAAAAAFFGSPNRPSPLCWGSRAPPASAPLPPTYSARNRVFKDAALYLYIDLLDKPGARRQLDALMAWSPPLVASLGLVTLRAARAAASRFRPQARLYSRMCT